jgi:hypothetical protein
MLYISSDGEVIEMTTAIVRENPADGQDEKETQTDRLLRIAEGAKHAKRDGGIDITRMTTEERRKILFGR